MRRPDWWIVACLALVVLMLWQEVGRASDVVPVQTIVLEAEGEGFEGMVAVAEVIRNRAIRGSRTHEEVCLAPRQFSAWNDRQWAQKRLKRAKPEVFEVAKRAWQASKGTFKARGATHYHTLDVRPYWAKGVAPCARIGNHVFYRGVK